MNAWRRHVFVPLPIACRLERSIDLDRNASLTTSFPKSRGPSADGLPLLHELIAQRGWLKSGQKWPQKPNDSCLRLLPGMNGLQITSSNGRNLPSGWFANFLHSLPEAANRSDRTLDQTHSQRDQQRHSEDGDKRCGVLHAMQRDNARTSPSTSSPSVNA